MTKFFLALLVLAIPIVYAIDDKLHAPSGSLILDAKNGSFIKSQKTIRVDKIENASGTAHPPSMLPIGGAFAVMPNVRGAWKPPVDCTTVVDGFMRAGHNGACTVPRSCRDCIIPVGTVLPNMNNENYPRGGDTSGGTGGANTQSTNVSVSNHPAHQHSVTSNVTVVGTNTFVSNHTHNHNLTYNKGHTHSDTAFTALSTFASDHKHASSTMIAGFVGDIVTTQPGQYLVQTPRLAMNSPSNPFTYNAELYAGLSYQCSGDQCEWITSQILMTVNESPYVIGGTYIATITSGTNGKSFSEVGRRNILQSRYAGDFIQVLPGDNVEIFGGTNTIIGNYTVTDVEPYLQYDEVTLNLDINTGIGDGEGITYEITGPRSAVEDGFRGIPVKGYTDMKTALTPPQTQVSFIYDVADRNVGGVVGSGDTCDGSNVNCRMSVTLNQSTVVSQDESVSQSHIVANPAVNNEPKYMSVIWVIRVK